MIRMKVTGLTIDPFTNMPIIILKDFEEKMALPIWIGLIEASAIATELEKIQLARPMTHDLLRNILGELDVKVSKVEVNDLADNTFYAKIFLKKDDEEIVMDSRPSDAIALALRTSSPIFVDRRVMEKSRRIDLSKTLDEDKAKQQKWTEILENLSPEDFGKYKM
ncbi:bifunctional nuclease family protein [Deltaproteobacteria bacterium PRO3]|nr:bifunctional nuclease family protein [Deltaproteobacteria bacterium PRO3]